MDQIRIIREKTELEGTCYFELLPGRYRRKCWNDHSLFLTEETWGFLEPIVRRFEPRYDHYAFLDVPRETWRPLVGELRELATQIRHAKTMDQLPTNVGYFWRETKAEFAVDFQVNRATLAILFEEISDWVEAQLRKHKYVAILGL